ncbi:MAG: glutaredoxin family protein [Chromatiales bacterium]|nr:glutaredoxin family protein [Chromatiales bacterium]
MPDGGTRRPGPTARLTVYSRIGCHLCEDMQAQLMRLQSQWNFEFEVIDIDEDAALRERFNVKVPVLALGDDIICCHFLDERSLLDALT